MGIRKRRRKLTTLMSRLDQRVKSVELRPISLLSQAEVEAAVAAGTVSQGPTAVLAGDAPVFIKIEDAYIYPKKYTGTEDRVEIYVESDLGVSVGDTLQISGIHGTQNNTVDVDGDSFEVKHVDTPPWDNRTLPGGAKHDPSTDQRTGVTISNTYSVKPEGTVPTTWSNYYRLQTKRQVDTYAISGTTVTLTMNSAHKFVEGDIVYINIYEADSRAYGIDGLFTITSVPDTSTIVYTLDAGVDSPVSATTPDYDVYVFPVAKKYLAVGSTWADSSNNKIYYWDGIRWVDYSTVANPVRDGDPPAPPTSLSLSDTPKVYGPSYTAYSEVVASWTAPTLTAGGEELTDLVGYKFKWRTSTSAPWTELDILNPNLTSYTFDQSAAFQQGTTYYFELYALDSGLQASTAATANITTQQKTGDHTTYPPTNPTATSRLGTITVTWDGRLKTGTSTSIPASSDIKILNIYVSTVNGFTPSSTTLAKSVRVFGSDGGFDVLTDLTYGTSYYIRISLTNSSGVEGSPSAQVTAQVQPLVDADLVTSALSEWPFNGGVVPAGALADGSLNASSLFGPDVITQSAISAGAIGANEIAAGAIIAGKIGASAVTAATIASGAITADKISSNAITADKIEAGAITAVKISSSAITSDKIDAGAITAAKISAGAITASKLESNLVLSDLIIVGTAYTGSISDPGRIEIRGANQSNPGIVAFKNGAAGATNATFRLYTGNGIAYLKDTFIDGNVTMASGGVIRTDVVGNTRVEIQDSTPAVDFYSGSTRIGRISPASTGLRIYGSGTAYMQVTAGTVNADNSSFSADGIHSYARLSQSLWTDTGTGAYTVNRNASGQLVPTSSDRRLKTNITSIDGALSKINQLDPVLFNWALDSSNPVKTPGLIAQDVANVFSEDEVFIVYRQDDPGAEGDYVDDPKRGMEYINLVPYLIKSIQELSAKNDELQARLDALEGK